LTSARQVDVDSYADRLNVRIVEAPLDGALAQLIVNGRSVRIFLSSRLCEPAQRRFAIAHELGHYVLEHSSLYLAELCEPVTHASHAHAQGYDLEREADRFARELLMPADEVDARCRRRAPDLELCAQLAISALVSIEHAAMRIAERSDRICVAVFSTSAGIASVVPSDRFRAELGASLTSTLREKMLLDPRTLASRISERFAPCAPAEVPAEAWLGAPGLPLLESSAATDAGSIVSLLWARRLEETQDRT
jgi:Zn-dependent peptidase ImmA (M78 family)